MDFNDTPAEAAFRTEARAWLAANGGEYAQPPPEPWPDREAAERARAWLRRKAEAGYATITWPRDVGGRGGTAMEEVIFAEEEDKYFVPQGGSVSRGLSLAIPAIRKHGTPEQFARFAGPTMRAEILWCQLFSEPSAGSDLAGLRTRAVKDGERWIVNGQKVWSSGAHYADWGILMARTDFKVPKHKGISFFLLDMKTPGIEVRPIRQINGNSEFNEVFLTDVAIPDDCRVGALGEGWQVAMTVLMNERAMSGNGSESFVRELARRARQSPRGNETALDSAAVRAKLAHWYAEEQGVKYFGYRLLTSLSKGEPPPASAAMVKLVSASNLQQTRAFAMDLDDFAGLFENPEQPQQSAVFQDYLWAAVMRIAGGADEILRNQLAERMLGLPGEIRVDKDKPFDELIG
jgi:acyl-CoA dehydrogenase